MSDAQPEQRPTEPMESPPSSPTPSPPESSTSPQAPSSDEPKKPPRGLVEHRTFNHNIVVIGKPGSGKSVWALRRALDFARQPCYVVAHDVGWKLPDELPDGKPTHVKRFRGAHDAREAFARDPRGVFALSSYDAGEVFALAKDISAGSLEANGGDKGNPCILLIDEVVSAGICDPNKLDFGFKRLLAERRHDHVGIISTCQSARLLHNQLLTLSTEIILFQVTDRRDHKRLIECGIDEEVVAQAAKLPPYKHIVVRL